MDKSRDYYCSLKFRYLKIDMESGTTYNCHAAKSHPIDFNRLESNPGQLFNIDINVSERQMMLDNIRNPSCEQNCWPAEDQNAISPRLYQNGTTRTHFNIRPLPEIVDLTINSDCNLTCSYCCKEYSSSWRNDLDKNGPYPVTTEIHRYSLSDKDKILMKIKQAELKESSKYKKLLTEIRLVSSGIKQMDITGGEPLLDNQLADIITSFNLPGDAKIIIYSGLGIEPSRLQKLCVKLSRIPNVQIEVSAENIGKNLEFNRYGVVWEKFKQNIEILQKNNINYGFHSTISNLTIFGFVDFYKYFSSNNITLTFCYQPKMMAPYVLDNNSKKMLVEQFEQLPDKYKLPLIKSIQAPPLLQQQQDLHKFLKEFVSRRSDLDTKIFPDNFLTWMESNVV